MNQQIQPLKKRMVEEQNQRQLQQVQEVKDVPQIQYIHYIPAPENNAITLQQSNNIPMQQFRVQKQETLQYPQVIKIEPMMLNAWTQTDNDYKTKDELWATIKQLQLNNAVQSEIIKNFEIKEAKARNVNPVRFMAEKNISSSEVPIEYRIINNSTGPNNETQIEIEITDENSRQFKDEAAEVEIDEKENSFVGDIYAQIAESPLQNKPKKFEGPLVSIGPNGTKVPSILFEKISWNSSSSIATRKLLGCIFDRETLASHSMTGKASPAFKGLNKPIKNKLDTKAIEDIIYVVTNKCGVSAKEVRSAITTKCADENKMLKLKALKNMHAKSPFLTNSNRKKK